MTTPRVSGSFDPRPVGDDTVWVSADGVWTLVPRHMMDRLLGRGVLGPDPMGQTAQDLGLVMGTGVEEGRPGAPRRRRAPEPADVNVVMVPRGGFAAPSAPSPVPPPVPAPAPVNATQGPRMMMLAVASLAMLMASVGVLLLAFGVVWWQSASLTAAVKAEDVASSVLVPVPPLPVGRAQDTGSPEATPLVAVRPGWPPAGLDPKARPGRPRRAPVRTPAWQVYIDLGWKELGDDPSAAADAFQRALVLYPSHAEAHRGLGEAWIALGQPQRGATSLCEARRLDASIAALVSERLADKGLTCDDVTP